MKIDVRNWEEFEDDFVPKQKIVRKKKKVKDPDINKKKDNYKKGGEDVFL